VAPLIPWPAKSPAARKLVRAVNGPRSRALLSLALAGSLVAAVGTLTSSSAQADTEVVVQAESFNAQSGALLEPTADTGGGQNAAYLADGDWLSYPNVDLGSTGSLTAKVRVASLNTAGGTVELRADAATGPVLASFAVTSTGGWQTWVTLSASTMPMVTGSHPIFIALHSNQSADFVNINWFSITGSASSTPMPSMTTSAPGTWLSVDPVQQAADTKAFFALTPKPITGNPVRVPEFNAGCAVTHHLSDDPIVFPGQAGASHNHTFLGNTTTDANSTLASLKAGGTNCSPVEDKSAYWIPTLYANGTPVDPAGNVTVYYGSRLIDPSQTQPFPEGFRMIAGDAKQQTDINGQGNHFYCAGIGGAVGLAPDGVTPICAPTANLNYQLVFPDCWDGVHLDSPNHKAHVSDAVNGTCPAAFPVPIPTVSFVIAYPVGLDTTHITLASGTTSSMHGDFFNAWDPAAQAARVRNCLDQSAKCNSAGNF
jgi:Domain of unknown function (DUF1996)/Carbohydrate binding module (family 6)